MFAGPHAGGRNLQRDRLSAPYRARLHDAASGFYQYCKRRGHSLRQLSKSASLTGDLLVDYVQTLYDNQKPLWVAKHAVLAMQTIFRHHRGHLRRAWDSIQSWQLERPIRSRVPLRPELLEAICTYAVLAALRFDRKRALVWWSFTVSLKVAFHGLLRPKELFNLRCSEIRLPQSRVFMDSWVSVITILEPKNRAAMGRVQVRLIRDSDTLAWMLWFIPHLPGSCRLWVSSPRTFRSCLSEALTFLSLDRIKVTAGSLRAGGATFRLEKGVHPQNIKFQGGWASERSLWSYLQEAEAASTLLKLSPSQTQKLELLLNEFSFLRRPPALPLSRLV